MTEPVQTASPDVDAQLSDDELLHIHCCDDPDLALCGKDISGYRYTRRGELPTCETCSRIEDTDSACEPGRSPLCPLNVLGGDAP